MKDCRLFIFCRDRAEGRRVRRSVAEQGVGFNVQVGTWLELVQASQAAYLTGEPVGAWHETLDSAIADSSDAFWGKSYQIAPEETTSAVASELERLLRGLGPEKSFISLSDMDLSERATRHLKDLNMLHQSMGSLLPDDLTAVQNILQADGTSACRYLKVVVMAEQGTLGPWQEALVDKLNRDSFEHTPGLPDRRLAELHCYSADVNSALSSLQQNLYAKNADVTKIDDTLQWLAVRDYLEEVEVAAGMIQRTLKEDATLQPSDIALLLPEDPAYSTSVQEVFNHAGLVLSGLFCRQNQRDLARELLFHLLQTLRKPAPTMAMAAFVTSPLLPWSRATGFELAAALMEGDYRLKNVKLPSQNQNALLDLVRYGVDSMTGLRSLLHGFSDYLATTPELELQKRQLSVLCESLLPLLDQGETIPWDQLLAKISPRPVSQEIPGDLNREGIAVFYEHEEPWRQVKRLFVLGFNAGHYPREAKISAVFSDTDIEGLNAQGFCLETSMAYGSRLRNLFKRQLSSATGQVDFLLSRRDAFGKERAPSSSLSFIAQLLGRGEEPESLIFELDTEQGRQQAGGLALAAAVPPLPARRLEIDDLQLNMNLLEINKREDGSLRPQSPSGLETLLTSPLAWLLNRAGLEPKEWGAETLDVMAKGSLAHAVFEHLFVPGHSLPSRDDVEAQVPKLLREVTQTMMPYLNRPEWKVERYHLENEILQAALRWQEVLAAIDARVVGVEVWLKGVWGEQPIHGSADLLMALPDGKIYVVDYKKSSSKKRRERMTRGYDSQASLYRIMLQSGTASFRLADGSTQDFEASREIGVLYYLMNDQVALTDTPGWLPGSLADCDELGADVAVNALKLIRQRLDQVALGKVALNRTGDEKWFADNASIPLYALNNSPLIRMFMLPAEEEN